MYVQWITFTRTCNIRQNVHFSRIFLFLCAWIYSFFHYFLIASADDPPAEIPPEMFPYLPCNDSGGRVLLPPWRVYSLEADRFSEYDEPSPDVLQIVTENFSLTIQIDSFVFPIAPEWQLKWRENKWGTLFNNP